MMNARYQAISEMLDADETYAKQILNLEPAEAVESLTAKGYDFTKEELEGFMEEVKNSMKEGELNEDDLNDVAGGCKVCFGIGVGLGVAAVYLLPW